MSYWYEKYIGIPWEAHPEPPKSFHCGELVRYIYREHLGISMVEILAPGDNAKRYIKELMGCELRYDLFCVSEDDVRPLDVVVISRRLYRDHAGLVVQNTSGLFFLHCAEGIGVVLDNLWVYKAVNMPLKVEYFRHKQVTEDMVKCLV